MLCAFELVDRRLCRPQEVMVIGSSDFETESLVSEHQSQSRELNSSLVMLGTFLSYSVVSTGLKALTCIIGEVLFCG